jgi:hypothetical protein
MNVDANALLSLWKLDEIPACDEGMVLARQFLESCVMALESGSSGNFNARFENYERHRGDCDKCNEV